MNSKSTITVLVAALAVLSGAMGMSMTGVFSDQEIMTASTRNVAVGLMTGHLEIEAKHMNGELFDYRQLDNIIVNDGEQCILKMLFATTTAAKDRGGYATTGTGACTGILTGAWNFIAIGTCNAGDEAPASCTSAYAEGNNEAQDDVLVRLGNETSTSPGLQRGMATTITWTNGTAGAATKIVLAKTFTSTSPITHLVGESGLFNSSANDAYGMLARQTFTDVTLGSGDSITVTWTFTVGN
mgnify:CR=1 FL=1